MIRYREIIRLRSSGVSIRNIAYSCECSKTTVQHVLRKATAKGLSWPLPKELDDKEIYRILFPKDEVSSEKALPDFEQVNKELLKKGMTLMLLWSEYCEHTIADGKEPYQYSAFCNRYRSWAKTNQVVMHIERRPAEQIMVDWCGGTLETIDRDSGEMIKVYVFAACLAYSSYLYAEGFYRMDQEAWLTAHIHAFEFYGGTTPILIPDNLKTGITKNSPEELIINESYRRMSEYYGCAVVPTRVRKPRDKGAIESGVGLITRQAMAPLRNRTFFSLNDLNDALQEKVSEINARPFQKREGSRESVFYALERDALIPLPAQRFEIYVIKTATVPYNYHVSVDSVFYSVPFTYAKCEVELRISKSTVAIYDGTERIALHKRTFAYKGAYVTNPDHMPDTHKDFTEWNGKRFRRWAAEIGEGVAEVIDAILNSKPIEQHAYRSCRAIIALGKKYGNSVLDEACMRALALSRVPTYKALKAIIIRMTEAADKTNKVEEHVYLRGASYFESELFGGGE